MLSRELWKERVVKIVQLLFCNAILILKYLLMQPHLPVDFLSDIYPLPLLLSLSLTAMKGLFICKFDVAFYQVAQKI